MQGDVFFSMKNTEPVHVLALQWHLLLIIITCLSLPTQTLISSWTCSMHSTFQKGRNKNKTQAE